jgi:hypothetical protein
LRLRAALFEIDSVGWAKGASRAVPTYALAVIAREGG